MFNKAMLKAVSARRSPLPSGYTQCEYLESTGTQYINTGYANTNGCIQESEFAYLDNQNNQYMGIMGSETNPAGQSRNNLAVLIKNNRLIYGGAGIDLITTFSPALGRFYKYESNTIIGETNYIKIDGGIRATGQNTSQRSSTSIALFAFTKGAESQYANQSIGRMRYARISDDNHIIVRNFIPCIRSSDLKPGMYDTIRKQFFVNQGTGEFLYGPLSLPSGLHQSGDPYMYNGHGCVDVTNVNTGSLAIYDLVTRRLTYYSV